MSVPAVRLVEVQPFTFPDPAGIEARMGKALIATAIRTKARAARRFAGLGIGRRFFAGLGGKRSKRQGPGDVRKLESFFRVGRMGDLSRAFVVDLTAKGPAGIQETGGRTEKHYIESMGKRATYALQGETSGILKGRGKVKSREISMADQPRLAFMGRAGHLMRPRVVVHPGGVLRKKPAVEPELPQALTDLDRFVMDILDRSFNQSWTERGIR